MDADVATYMFSTLDACCSAYFAWNYNACMGDLDNTCARALWYPDWEGTNSGCKRDGNEPLYMTENAVSVFKTMRFSLDATPCLQISQPYLSISILVRLFTCIALSATVVMSTTPGT